MYSIMLYIMKTRVTFRIAPDLADSLRDLPNQTTFVEDALRRALGRTCPACEGAGRIRWKSVAVSDFRRTALPRLDRNGAKQLKGLVQLARELAASKLDLTRSHASAGFDFVLSRGDDVLMRGMLEGKATTFHPN
jgi:hypothetical protein